MLAMHTESLDRDFLFMHQSDPVDGNTGNLRDWSLHTRDCHVTLHRKLGQVLGGSCYPGEFYSKVAWLPTNWELVPWMPTLVSRLTTSSRLKSQLLKEAGIATPAD